MIGVALIAIGLFLLLVGVLAWGYHQLFGDDE